MRVKVSSLFMSTVLAALLIFFVCTYNGHNEPVDEETSAQAVVYVEEEYPEEERKEYIDPEGRRYYSETDVQSGETILYRSKNSGSWGLDPDDPENWEKYKTYTGDISMNLESLGIMP